MKYLRRFLLLIPLALLGAALLVRSHSPRPQTEGDQWLWKLGEDADMLEIVPRDIRPSLTLLPDHNAQRNGSKLNGAKPQFAVGLAQDESVSITDRQSIRSVLRAFETTSDFVNLRAEPSRGERPKPSLDQPTLESISIAWAAKDRRDRVGRIVLLRQSNGYKLSQTGYAVPPAGSGKIESGLATTNMRSVGRFLTVVRALVVKARRHQRGYGLHLDRKLG